MTSELDTVELVKTILKNRGKQAVDMATAEVIRASSEAGKVGSALKYFLRVTVPGALPVFPALVSLSTDAAGGETDKSTAISAGLAMLTWSADIHDDIIDQSVMKYSRKTVYGKYGSSIAILAGDLLLTQGYLLLGQEGEFLSCIQRKTIQDLIRKCILEITKAEANELSMMQDPAVSPREYLKIIRLKAVVPEILCKIGAICANADQDIVKTLGRFGRTFGYASSIRDEFIDLLEYPELQNRLTNECPPMPMLYAMQNPKLIYKIKPLLENPNLGEKQALKIVKIILIVFSLMWHKRSSAM